jgi:16S rRNA (uracil1498-N3)-methyltransferase
MFYNPNPESLCLDQNESQHCAKVLRKKVGDTIDILDGQGKTYWAVLTSIGKVCKYEITQTITHTAPRSLIQIAVAPPKKASRFDFLIEKLVELGVNEIHLLETQNSERSRINEDRLKKQIVTACKQSKQYYIPKISMAVKLQDIVKLNQPIYVCHCIENNKKTILKDLGNKANGIWCIGPEGDFSQSEISFLQQNNATMVDLGEMRLRTETAAIFIASWLKYISF